MYRHITVSTSIVPALLLAGVSLGAVAQPAAAATLKHRVSATEVTVRAKKVDEQWLRGRLITASDEEARYYERSLPIATMRIVVDKLSTKSAGKAIAANLPLVGMFAGANENRLKGRVEILDPATGRVLKKIKVDCDDNTQFSAADGVFALADLGTSFLPFGGLFSIAADIGRSAANKRADAQEKLVRGFVMLSYKKLYGNKAYKQFADSRKAALAAEKAAGFKDAAVASAPLPASAIAPAATVAAVPAVASPAATQPTADVLASTSGITP